ncbi:hypothetical protein BV22DRAFT_46761 [Leucogyrophana mollusca]|uniref:Uncharacterized protein n=1 Tax=Leucogyrophana mollusca TaxID=85980 RepID=A0ACB8BZ43_9AGAM|nr:hypothetical protein BV22DRAFT_46761 [Leucogyrophana mollusca]
MRLTPRTSHPPPSAISIAGMYSFAPPLRGHTVYLYNLLPRPDIVFILCPLLSSTANASLAIARSFACSMLILHTVPSCFNTYVEYHQPLHIVCCISMFRLTALD